MQICNFIKSESLAQLFSCEICEICRNTFFAENHRTTASDYSSINKSEEETLESEEVLESLYNKFSGLKLCNSIKKRQVFSCGNCNFSNITFFTEQFQWLLLRFNSYFQRTLSNKYHIQLQKNYLLPRGFRSSHRRCSVKEDLQLYQKEAPVLLAGRLKESKVLGTRI